MENVTTVFFQGNQASRLQATKFAGKEGLDIYVTDNNVEHVYNHIVLFEEVVALRQRVERIEDAMCTFKKKDEEGLSVVPAAELYVARIDYSNEVTRQWKALKQLLNYRTTTMSPMIVDARILCENVEKLVYYGIKCEAVPYTHYTMLSFVGLLEAKNYLDTVD